MKRIALVFFVLFFLVSCSKYMQIESSVDGVELHSGEVKQALPAVVKVSPFTTLSFTHPSYETIEVEGRQILQADSSTWTVDMGDPLIHLQVTGLKGVGVIEVDGIPLDHNEGWFPSGTYDLSITCSGYESQTLELELTEDRVITFSGRKIYRLSEYPPEIQRVDYMGEPIEPGDTLIVEQQSPIMTLHMGTDRIEIFLNPRGTYLKEDQLDLETLIRSINLSNDNDSSHEISVDGSWLHHLEDRPALAPFEILPIGFEDEPPLITEKNFLIKNPGGFFPDISIANPTDELIGARVVLETSSEQLLIEITSDFLQSNKKDVYGVDYETWESGSTAVLNIANLDFRAPFHRTICSVRLEKGGDLLDQTEFAEDDLSFFLANHHVGLYKHPRDTFFESVERGKSDQYFLYLSEKYEGQFICFYEIAEDNLRIPLFVFRLKNIDDSPVIITLSERGQEKRFCFRIEETITPLQDPEPRVYWEHGRFGGSRSEGYW